MSGDQISADNGRSDFNGATGMREVCQQCGRIGVRGFEHISVVVGEVDYGDIVQCANRKACARRYERQRPASELDYA